MSSELVRVTIDEHVVHVPKGMGIVETALSAGIEIPVFCYEPRLGEAIGACRMCLVEVEGMPKLQTACTMTAQDGLVVKTARTWRPSISKVIQFGSGRAIRPRLPAARGGRAWRAPPPCAARTRGGKA